MVRPVRLSQEEIDAIKSIAKDVFGEGVRVWLFGSRTDPLKKGGDIDLYIEAPTLEKLLDKKIEFLLKLEEKIGEQKIDLIVKPLGCEEEFCRRLKEEAVEL